MRSLHKGAILILEGDTDARVYKRFISEKDCRIIPAHNKDNAIKALKILEDEKFAGLLCVVDADFWNIEGIQPESSNLLLTETHDLETMMLSNEAVLKRILSEFGATSKIERLPKSVQAILCDCTLPIGLLRWLCSSSKENLPLSFRGLPFENFVDKTKLQTDIDKMIAEVHKNSTGIKFDGKLMKSKIKSLKKENHDPWQVCSGHDMVQVFAIGLKFTFGNKNSKKLEAEILAGILRVTYGYSDFRSTWLYSSIKDWEKENPPFKVLIP